jgi:hypothetical protein
MGNPDHWDLSKRGLWDSAKIGTARAAAATQQAFGGTLDLFDAPTGEGIARSATEKLRDPELQSQLEPIKGTGRQKFLGTAGQLLRPDIFVEEFIANAPYSGTALGAAAIGTAVSGGNIAVGGALPSYSTTTPREHSTYRRRY